MPRPRAHEGETQREYAWRVYAKDALEIRNAVQAPSVRCRRPLCHASIWWGTTRAGGRPCAFDIKPDGTRSGTAHWRTCRDKPETDATSR
jgi:hypothetical protein